MDCGLAVDAPLRPHGPDRQAVTLLEPPPQGVRLGEEQAGVEGEHVDRQVVAGDEVDEDATLGAEGGGEGDAGCEAAGRPGKHVRGRSAFQGPGGIGDFHYALQNALCSLSRARDGRAPRHRQARQRQKPEGPGFCPGRLSVVCVRGA